ncbi:syntaxin-31 isoform X2 [Amborella trichopoda]|uniref:syntaxin-31 isoform X2 n=1 Tax=Amborella trichopoda TaxID=13333 RepID=UPI0009C07ADB|nr:syntaxin-31 isoform X2 [Amborella trichopoda]|eukprot:XP_020525169.1 syntaxin-31 isoform X2 [Amborella trichopoda]
MASSSASSYRDRTFEFHSLSERLKKSSDLSGNRSGIEPEASSSTISSQSDFNKRASRIGLGIHEASQKIGRLAKLAKRSSIFDDPVEEIQELTAFIKNDIQALNIAVSDLQALQNSEIADGNFSNDRVGHSTTIVDDLKNRLMGTTKEFKDVLTTRTENIKAHENRKQIFSANALRENPFTQQSKANGASTSNQLRRRLTGDTPPSHHMEMQMLQQTVPRQENYMQNRAVALQNVESTISELGGIFTQLATMVAQQGELAIRIDDNVDESLSNVEGARSSLLKHLNSISSNRWLLIKIFAVLIFFMLLFVFFVL